MSSTLLCLTALAVAGLFSGETLGLSCDDGDVPRYVLTAGRRRLADDILEETVVEFESCEQQCSESPECAAFDYATTRQVCVLHRAATAIATDMHDDALWLNAGKLCTPHEYSQGCAVEFVRQPQHMLVGLARHVVSSSSLAHCTRLCLQQHYCRSIDYLPLERFEQCIMNAQTQRSHPQLFDRIPDEQDFVVEYVERAECNGEWNVWSEWSDCQQLMQPQRTKQTRTRQCVPAGLCVGAATERRDCGTAQLVSEPDDPFGVDPALSAWSAWSECDPLGTIRVRTRRCWTAANCPRQLRTLQSDPCPTATASPIAMPITTTASTRTTDEPSWSACHLGMQTRVVDGVVKTRQCSVTDDNNDDAWNDGLLWTIRPSAAVTTTTQPTVAARTSTASTPLPLRQGAQEYDPNWGDWETLPVAPTAPASQPVARYIEWSQCEWGEQWRVADGRIQSRACQSQPDSASTKTPSTQPTTTTKLPSTVVVAWSTCRLGWQTRVVDGDVQMRQCDGRVSESESDLVDRASDDYDWIADQKENRPTTTLPVATTQVAWRQTTRMPFPATTTKAVPWSTCRLGWQTRVVDGDVQMRQCDGRVSESESDSDRNADVDSNSMSGWDENWQTTIPSTTRPTWQTTKAWFSATTSKAVLWSTCRLGWQTRVVDGDVQMRQCDGRVSESERDSDRNADMDSADSSFVSGSNDNWQTTTLPTTRPTWQTTFSAATSSAVLWSTCRLGWQTRVVDGDVQMRQCDGRVSESDSDWNGMGNSNDWSSDTNDDWQTTTAQPRTRFSWPWQTKTTPTNSFNDWMAWGGWSGCGDGSGSVVVRHRRRLCPVQGACYGADAQTQRCADPAAWSVGAAVTQRAPQTPPPPPSPPPPSFSTNVQSSDATGGDYYYEEATYEYDEAEKVGSVPAESDCGRLVSLGYSAVMRCIQLRNDA